MYSIHSSILAFDILLTLKSGTRKCNATIGVSYTFTLFLSLSISLSVHHYLQILSEHVLRLSFNTARCLCKIHDFLI